MVRKTTKNIKRVQETTAEVLSRLSDYLGSNQVTSETGIQGEVTGGSNMAPKKRKAASKRKRSPTPDGEVDIPVRETRARSRRVQFAPENEDADEDFERELGRDLERELEEPLAPDAESYQPLRTIACYEAPERAAKWRERAERAALFEGPRAPTLFGGNTQQPRKHIARDPRDIHNPTPEERLDWYLDAALKEVRRVQRLARQDKLRQADLWDLLTFGQHMSAGMKQRYGIDLNAALLEREKKKMGGEDPEPEAGSLELPWPGMPPRRCPTCSRVVAADEERTAWEHPWNGSSFARLFPQEDRYDAGGVFGFPQGGQYDAAGVFTSGFTPTCPVIPTDPRHIPMRQGTTYRGLG